MVESSKLLRSQERRELERRAIHEAAIREAQLGQTCQGDERHRHEGRGHRAADLFPSLLHAVDFFAHRLRIEGIHQAGDRQFNESEDLSVGDHDHAAAAFDQRIRGESHVFVVRSDDEQVVRVVRNRRRHSPALDAESFDETVSERARFMMTLEHERLQNILSQVRLELAVDHGQIDMGFLRAHFAWQHLDRADVRSRVRSSFGVFDRERRRRDLEAEVHGVRNPLGEGKRRQLECGRAVFRDDLAVDEHARDIQIVEIVEEHDVGAFSRCNRPEVLVHLETLRAVDGDHLDGGDDVDAAFHGGAHDMIEVPAADERVGMGVVAHEHGEARVDIVSGDGFGEHGQILPR